MTENEVSQKKQQELTEQNKFMVRVYGWMTLALLISGTVAYFTAQYAMQDARAFNILFGKMFYVFAVAEIVLVWWLSASIQKLSLFVAGIAFFVYSVLNGITLASIFVVYNESSIFSIFFVSAAMFAAMAVYGTVTKSNILSFGRYFSMALIGIVIASLVNVILSKFGLSSGIFEQILSIITVVLFTGLTAYDAKKMLVASEHTQNNDTFKKASILGALELYLDFINIFLSLLRLFGKKR